jgi:hypothetical protein
MSVGKIDGPFVGFKFICCCLYFEVERKIFLYGKSYPMLMEYWNRLPSLQKTYTRGGSQPSVPLLNMSEMSKEIYKSIFDVLDMEMGTVLNFPCSFPIANISNVFSVLHQNE